MPTAASVRSSSRPLFSPSAWAAQAASRCFARVQLIAPTGGTLAAACSFSLLITSAAVLALGLGGTSRLALLGTRAALRPTGVTLAAACSFSSLIISAARARRSRPPAASARSSSWPLLSPSALPGASAAHHPAGSGRDARSQLIALTGATLVSYCASASSLPFYASSSSSPQQQHRISANAQWGGVRRWRGTLCLPLRMGVTAFPTSGHVAHGSVSSIDETRQPRVSSIARSRLGLPSQTRVTVTHTSVPSPISMRGAAPEVFASGTERELTGSPKSLISFVILLKKNETRKPKKFLLPGGCPPLVGPWRVQRCPARSSSHPRSPGHPSEAKRHQQDQT